MSCTPKQIDLQAFFVTTAALLCQCVIVTSDVNLQLHNANALLLVPPQNILTKQMHAKLMLCKPLFIVHGRVKAF